MGMSPDDIRDLCDEMKNNIQQKVEESIDEVSAGRQRHVSTRYKQCTHCFRTLDVETTRCQECSSREFCVSYCTNESRLLLFRQWLRSIDYWPLSSLSRRSCRDFVLHNRPWSSWTPCGLDEACPLTQAKERLNLNLRMPEHYGCQGLDLSNYDYKYREEPK